MAQFWSSRVQKGISWGIGWRDEGLRYSKTKWGYKHAIYVIYDVLGQAWGLFSSRVWFWDLKLKIWNCEVLVGQTWNCQGLGPNDGSNNFKTLSVMCLARSWGTGGGRHSLGSLRCMTCKNEGLKRSFLVLSWFRFKQSFKQHWYIKYGVCD